MKRQKQVYLNYIVTAATALAAQAAFADGPQISEIQQNITTPSTAYDTQGSMVQTVDPVGNTTTYAYDAEGSRSSSASGNTTTYQYDALDKATTPTGNPTSYTYDADGNDSTTTTTGGTTDSTYDQTGNSQTDTDTLGNVTRYQYDSATGSGQTTETDPLGRTTTYQYDTGNGPTSVSGGDPLGNTTTYTYDAASRQIQNTDALGGATTTNYDVAANATEDFTVPTQYQYDAVGNAVTTDAGSNFSVSLEDLTTSQYLFTYDASTDDALGRVTTYQYDSISGPNTGSLSGQLEGDLIPGHTYQYQYSYDINQNVSQTGSGTDTNSLTLTQLPEPGSIGLFLISTTTFLSRRRRARI